MEIKQLLFPADSPPLSVLAAAKVLSIDLATSTVTDSSSPPILVFSNGAKLRGLLVILRYIGRLANLYGQDAFESSQVDEWLEYSSVLSSGSAFESACSYLNTYLEKTTFLVGYCLSIADLAIWSGLAGTGLRWESLRKSKKYPNLARWFNSISTEYSAALNEVTSTYVGKKGAAKSAISKSKDQAVANGEAAEKGKTANRTAEVDLPDAEIGKVCLRFAPEPSGYLHIGHAKAALLNKYFAERYQGKLIVRFDDTNPAKESSEFVENLLKDIETLGIKYSKVTHTSDYFEELMKKAEELIKQGKAYVDDTPREQMQKERMDGIESKCRAHSVEENLKLWKEMIAGSERGRQCCLRGKLDMQDPNKSLRDPVYYRCNPVPHHRIGSKYNIYPTYDFACPYVDAIEGISHALRSSEYHDRNAQYHRIQEDLGVRKVHIYEFSRMNMVYTLLSKRNLRWFVENGKVDGWDDARFPTVQGIVRRGLKVEALVQFILEQVAELVPKKPTAPELWNVPIGSSTFKKCINLIYNATCQLLVGFDLKKIMHVTLFESWGSYGITLKVHGSSSFLGQVRVVTDALGLPKTNNVNQKWTNLKILLKGASKNLNLMEWDKLWTINKKLIDPVCPRHTAVVEENRVLFHLTDGPEKPFVRVIPRHKKYEGAGEKATTYTKRIWLDYADAEAIAEKEENREVTLMDWGNAIVNEISKDGSGRITGLSGVLNLQGSVKTTKLKLTWLPEINELVNITLVEFDYLITKKKLEEGENFLDVLNPCTKKETAALGDSNMRNLKRGEILQLERKGYFRCDVPFVRPSKPIILFAIPDGRQANASK